MRGIEKQQTSRLRKTPNPTSAEALNRVYQATKHKSEEQMPKIKKTAQERFSYDLKSPGPWLAKI
jgi:hypothetical protein